MGFGRVAEKLQESRSFAINHPIIGDSNFYRILESPSLTIPTNQKEGNKN
jgi:hypothetical protein